MKSKCVLKLTSAILMSAAILTASALTGCQKEDTSDTSLPTVTAPLTTQSQTSLPTAEKTETPTPPKTTPEEKAYTLTYLNESPVGGKIQGQTTQKLKPGEPSTTVIAVPDTGYKFVEWSDGSTNPEREGDTITRDREIYAYFSMETIEVTVPTVRVETDDGKWIYSKDYVTATVTVEGTDGGKHDGVFTTRIKGRGNSSWNGSAGPTLYDSKNSYRLKLDESQKFLGIGDSKNKDWVLNSCKFDASLLRNKIGYMMGEMLGFTYSAECTWAHVYLNGEYRGVYMVVEHVEAAKDRVEVDDSAAVEDIGFFLELDMRGHKEGVEGVDYFYVDGYAENEDNLREWVIKSDLSEDPELAKKQFEYIKNYMNEVNRAIETGNKEEIEKLVDIKSFVDMFICSEFSKDVDVNTASFFMAKDRGEKLVMTCPWDYDFGFGTYYIAISPSGLITETSACNQWFGRLILEKWFAQMVYDRLLEIEKDVFHIMKKTVAIGEGLREAADMNAEKWNLYGNKFHAYVDSGCSSSLYSYDDHLTFLYYWMYSRWDNMKIEVEFFLTEEF